MHVTNLQNNVHARHVKLLQHERDALMHTTMYTITHNSDNTMTNVLYVLAVVHVNSVRIVHMITHAMTCVIDVHDANAIHANVNTSLQSRPVRINA